MTRGLIALLLRFAPRDFRERRAGEMLAVHQERADGIAGWARWFSVREVVGTAVMVGRLHLGRLPLNGRGWSSQFQAENWPPERVGLNIVHRRANAVYIEAVQTPLIPIARTRTLRDVWSQSMAREEFVLTLLMVFGIVALLLAAVRVRHRCFE